ncbi:MAG: response regulator [Bacteroidota bacterium]
MKLNCLIIDDEPLARKGISEYVREIDFLQAVGEVGSAAEAASVIAKQSVDLLLLDIQNATTDRHRVFEDTKSSSNGDHHNGLQ